MIVSCNQKSIQTSDCNGFLKIYRKEIEQTRGINPFHGTGLFLYLLKTSENQRFSDVSWGKRKRPVE